MITFSGISHSSHPIMTLPMVRPLPANQKFSGEAIEPPTLADMFKRGTTADIRRASKELKDMPDFAQRLDYALDGFDRLIRVDAMDKNWRQPHTYPIARELMSNVLANVTMPTTPEGMAAASERAMRLLEKAKHFDTGFHGNDTLHRDIESLIDRMLAATKEVLAQPVAQAVLQVSEQSDRFQHERTTRDNAVAAREAKRAAKRAPWAVEYYARQAAAAAAAKS